MEYPFPKIALPFCALLVACFLVLSLAARSPAADPSYLAELKKAAHGSRLHESRLWRLLLHYKARRWGSGVESLADSESFFLAPGGKLDPQAELEATLESFFAPDPPEEDARHPQCAFIARYEFLKEALDFDPDRLPEHPCPQFGNWLENLDPEGITLVFPVAYLNNPASMFGHTLLRIDTPSQTEGTRLLAYTVSFAARTEEERGLPFALKGLFGGYPGKFSVQPYYDLVKEYGDIENRDLWEYRLDFDSEEVRRLLAHVWELKDAHFDYFFIDENCSYQLLSLLEVARPSLHLTDRFELWAVPSDTLRAVTASPGLLEDVTFRPSRRTVLQARRKRMPPRLQQVAEDLAEGRIAVESREFEKLSIVDQARALELAVDYMEYQRASESSDAAVDEAALMRLLEARARLDAPPQTPPTETPQTPPHRSHKSSRLAAGYGWEDASHFLQVDFRPVYHDLMDPRGGFIRGARLEFLETAVRYYPEARELRLERLELLDILSMAPRDRFLKPYSWKAGVAVEQARFSGEEALTGRFRAGAGAAWETPLDGLAAVFAEGTALVSDRFDEKVAAGAGPSLTVVHDITERWRMGLSARLLMYFLGVNRTAHNAVLSQGLSLSDQSALRFNVSHERQFGGGLTAVELSWHVYF